MPKTEPSPPVCHGTGRPVKRSRRASFDSECSSGVDLPAAYR